MFNLLDVGAYSDIHLLQCSHTGKRWRHEVSELISLRQVRLTHVVLQIYVDALVMNKFVGKY